MVRRKPLTNLVLGAAFFTMPAGVGSTVACVKDSVRERMQELAITEEELLTRLVFAEGISANLESDAECKLSLERGLRLIAWGVRNRVELSKTRRDRQKEFGAGWWGVIFQKGQFNPAISAHSRYSEYFRCPQKAAEFLRIWPMALRAAQEAMGPYEKIPFPREGGLSQVAYFYYPLSPQATKTPPKWADPQGKRRIRDLGIADKCLWFFTI